MNPGKNEKEILLTEAYGYKIPLTAYAFGIVKNWQTAEDVVQEALVVISKKWDSYESGHSVFLWVRGIVRYKAYKAIHSLEREKPTERDRLDSYIESKLDDVWNESANDCMQEKIGLLRGCISNLPDTSRSLLTDFYFHGRPYQKIADDLGKSLSFVKDNLFRLRKRLRECVASKKREDADDAFETGGNHELLDELFNCEISADERELVLNHLESQGSGELLFLLLVEHAAFVEVLKEAVKANGKNSDAIEESNLNIYPNAVEAAYDFVPAEDESVSPFTRLRSTVWQGIAACLILGIGLIWWLNPKSVNVEFAQITLLEGKVSLLRAGTDLKIPVGLNSPISPGDTIVTERDSLVHIELAEQATQIEVSELSRFQIGNARSEIQGNRFHLDSGTIIATISRQDVKNPAVFSTNHAEVIVLGTRFKLASTPRKSFLNVIEGRVSFKNSQSGESVIVKQNQSYRIDVGLDRITSVTGSVSADGLREGLVSHFRFDEESGNIVYDTSTFETHGTIKLQRPEKAWVPGRFGTAIRFPTLEENDRKPRTIEANQFRTDRISSQMSLSVWLRPFLSHDDFDESDPTRATTTRIVASRDVEAGKGWFVGMAAVGGERFRVQLSINSPRKGGAIGNTAVSFADIVLNEWAHAAIVFDSGVVAFYINGKKSNEKELFDDLIKPSAKGLGIGPIIALSLTEIDELSIYNRALDLSEVQRLSHSGQSL